MPDCHCASRCVYQHLVCPEHVLYGMGFPYLAQAHACHLPSCPHLVQIPDVPHHELKHVFFQIAGGHKFEIQFERLHTDFAVRVLHRKVLKVETVKRCFNQSVGTLNGTNGSTENTYLHEFTVHLSGQTFATGDIRVFLRVVAGEERREQREQREESRHRITQKGQGVF